MVVGPAGAPVQRTLLHTHSPLTHTHTHTQHIELHNMKAYTLCIHRYYHAYKDEVVCEMVGTVWNPSI